MLWKATGQCDQAEARNICWRPEGDTTKCPKLNRVVEGSTSKETREADITLGKLLLDTVAPLVHILETAQSGDLSIDTSVKAAKLTTKTAG